MMERAGRLVTNLSGEAAYKSFTPTPLPPNPPIALDKEAVELLVKANKQLTLLEGIAARIPNVNLFISMYVRKEALMSSQIEGTQATLEDVLDPLIDENANLDIAEVINYIKATEYSIARLKELPLCNRLIKEAHGILMEGSRGQEKNPGEFRYSQNWIGGQGSTLKNARFIPPTPEEMTAAISDFEKYINNGDYMAKSTMLAIFGRLACYTGKRLTWDDALNMELPTRPSGYTWDSTPPTLPDENGRYKIEVPGKGLVYHQVVR